MKIGLTGSIAMGKSRTAQIFRDMGFPVFDADATVHKLYQKGGPASRLLGKKFPAIVSDGAIDRQKVMSEIDAGRIDLEQIEKLVHPIVRIEQVKFYQTARANRQPLVIFDIPLIYETHTQATYDKIIVVFSPLAIQAKRALARDGMTEEKLRFIRAQQVPDQKKRNEADYVIDTSVSIRDAMEQAENIARQLCKYGYK